ncbi:MAG TPA: SRPBCC family protein [Candidatus Limnocylindrales bacterium]|nr:SRPBCC family protein [Candidatus Limnocylindrales bacterium]
MIDIVKEIEASRREVTEGRIAAGPGRSVRLTREYGAPIDDVWDAVTNPERIGRWFLPITGEYRLGGRYQFEGNAGGEIVACEKPNRLKVTWVYGEPTSDADLSEVEVRLSALDGETTRFELVHTAIVPEDRWAEYGPGAVGVGWEQGLLGLTLHLRGERDSIGDPVAWQLSDEGREFASRSSVAWGKANVAAGADPAVAAKAVENTTAFYAPDPETVP